MHAVGMQAFREVVDVPLVVRHPRKPREEVPQDLPDVQDCSECWHIPATCCTLSGCHLRLSLHVHGSRHAK